MKNHFKVILTGNKIKEKKIYSISKRVLFLTASICFVLW